ncbi:hypothetical protein ABPG75_007752 [Micractinium tetrahymenae]
MGASLSTDAEETGVTVVSHGAGRSSSSSDGDALLRQLSQLKHSLPLIPEFVESSSTWSKALQRSSPAAAASSSDPPVPRVDGEPLEQLVADYQRFSRWHCRRIVEKQELLAEVEGLVERQTGTSSGGGQQT